MSDRTITRIKARSLTSGYGSTMILNNLSIDIPSGKVTTIIGPNGCGKSTLLKTMCHLLPIDKGSVMIDGVSVERMKRKDIAKKLAVLPQTPTAPEGLIVADLVARGRHPHQTWLKQWSSDDEEKVAEALNLTGARAFAERPLDSLSGGQRQRVWISMVLAQDTDLVFLDEPTTYLDQSHSIEILDLVHKLTRQQGKTVVMVLHDLNLALRYSDHLVIMDHGRAAAAGSPEQIITPEILADVFHLNAIVIEDPVTGGPMIVPKAPKHIRDNLRAKADAEEKRRAAQADEDAARLERASRAYAEAEAAEEAKTAAKRAAKAADVKSAKTAEVEQLEDEQKKAASRARQLRAKAAKFESDLDDLSDGDIDRDALTQRAQQARAKAEDAEQAAQAAAQALAEAKSEAEAAEEQARATREEARQAQARMDALTDGDATEDTPDAPAAAPSDTATTTNDETTETTPSDTTSPPEKEK